MKNNIETRSHFPKGFLVGSCHAGIRKVKDDLALIYSQKPATAAGVFTQNQVQAAPVTISKNRLKTQKHMSAIIVNSGNANACTGKDGYEDALRIGACVAQALKIKSNHVFISSTGVIGKRLPVETIMRHIPELVLSISPDKIMDVAEAIMTTDLAAKQSYSIVNFPDGSEVKIYAIAKGSGMIAPNMATMLAFVMTDASISKATLQKVISKATKKSFNRISVDGDESTNDMVLALANGMAENKIIVEHTKEFELFYNEMAKVMVTLAKMIVKDGEGATKLIEIRVKGAKSDKDADMIAKSIAKSPLVKTAFYGADANWGRILCAMGYSGVSFNPEKVSIHFNDVPILLPNYILALNEELAKKVLLLNEIVVTVNLNLGSKESVFWTCDFSEKYVTINSNYRS